MGGCGGEEPFEKRRAGRDLILLLGSWAVFFGSLFVFLFCVAFLFVLGSFWGAFWGRFGSQKLIKMRTCDLLKFIGFPVVFQYFLGFGRVLISSYFGYFFDPFFASIFGVFWVRFGCHFGRVWGAQVGHFGHRFWDLIRMSFQERPKSGQERPKSGQERPKSDPRAAKSGPRAAKSGLRAAKSGLRAAQERPRAAIMCVFGWFYNSFVKNAYFNS